MLGNGTGPLLRNKINLTLVHLHSVALPAILGLVPSDKEFQLLKLDKFTCVICRHYCWIDWVVGGLPFL